MIARGFARTPEQLKAIQAHGLDDRAIYMDGRGAETLEACVDSFRSRPGTLVIAHDLRVFGASKRAIAAFMDEIEKLSIKVRDLSNPEDLTHAAMIQRANVAISGSRFRGDRKRARRQGRDGGMAKGRAAQARRDQLSPQWLIDRIVDHPSIPWPLKRELLEPHFPESTLRRHYGAQASARRK